jgi:undecaprenyl-diphosphatase
VDYSVLGTDWIKFFFEGVSFLGSAYFVVPFSCLVCIWLFRWRQRRVAVTLMILLGGSSLAGSWLKGWFERPRPFFCLADTLATNGCLSFPSGHAATAVYFYGLLAFLVFRFGSWRLKKFLRLVVGAAGFIGLIGLSRVVLRVHYPSDVIGGFLLGMVFLLLAILLIEVFYYEKK